MSNAILASRNRENPICAICLNGFAPNESQWTHVGGENHDPFHYPCLRRVIRVNQRCPFDRTKIDPNSLLARTEQIHRKASFTCASIASIIGTSSALATHITASAIGADDPSTPSIIGLGVGVAITIGARMMLSVTLSQRLGLDSTDDNSIHCAAILGTFFGAITPLGLKTQLICAAVTSASMAWISSLSRDC